MTSYPTMPRVASALAALAAAAYLIVLQPASLRAEGQPLTALAMAATAVPLVAILLWVALAPASLQKVLRRVSHVDLQERAHFGAFLTMVATLYYVVGFASLVGGAFAYETATDQPAGPIPEEALVSSLLLNVVLLVLPVVLYVSFVRGKGPGATLRDLGLRSEGIVGALAWGVASAFVAILLIALVALGLQQGGVTLPENDRALAIAKSVSVPGALAIATFAALSEEVFFRGFLQPRIGLVGQSVLFSLAHLSYVNLTETVVTFLLALAFGLLYRWTGNLWAPIAAHFAFNLLMLLAGMAAT